MTTYRTNKSWTAAEDAARSGRMISGAGRPAGEGLRPIRRAHPDSGLTSVVLAGFGPERPRGLSHNLKL